MGLTIEEQLWMARHERANMLDDFLFVEGVNERLLALLIRPNERGGFHVHLPDCEGGYAGGEAIDPGLYRFAFREHAIEAIYVAAGVRGADGLLTDARLSVEIDPGDAPQELITEYFLALDAIYRSMGGSGLRIIAETKCNDKSNC